MTKLLTVRLLATFKLLTVRLLATFKLLTVRLLATFSVLTLSLVACTQEDPGIRGTGDSASEDARLAEACDANARINSGFNKVFEGIPAPEGPPSPEVVKQIQERMDREVIPHVEKIETIAPQRIDDEIKTAAKAVRDLRKDPGQDPFQKEEVEEAVQEIDEYFYEECDNKKIAVQAREYEFANVPGEVEAGRLAVKLENEGKEVHEFAVMTKKEGVTESFDAILALEHEQTQDKVTFVGGAHAHPGDEAFAILTFEKPGDYIAVCFVRQGTTEEDGRAEEAATGSPTATGSPDTTPAGSPGASPAGSPGASPAATGSPGAPATEEEGPPHFTLGMKKEFKVV